MGRFALPLLLASLLVPATGPNDAAPHPRAIRDGITAAGETFRVVRLFDGLEHPWSLAILPDGRFLVSERAGRLILLDLEGTRQEVRGLPPVRAAGQGGLLDLALHPEFRKNGLLYWTFAIAGPGGSGTALARGRLSGSVLSEAKTLWVMPSFTASVQHYGSRVRFGVDGRIYVTVGDRGDGSRARSPMDAAGKVIRLDAEGGVPADNPFAGSATHLPEIFSLGHRNPQGLAIRPGSGQIWLSEHGPRGGDEINLVRAGLDYGWPLTTYGVDYSGAPIATSPTAPGIEPPAWHWTPSIAPSGLEFYAGTVFGSWRGHLLSGSLAGQKLVLLELSGNSITRQRVVLDGEIGRIRDVRVGPDGLVYLLTDSANGGLYRLEP